MLQLSCTCGYAIRLTVGLVRRPLGTGPEFPSRITVTCSTGQVVRERVTSLEPVLNVTSPVVRGGGGGSWAWIAAGSSKGRSLKGSAECKPAGSKLVLEVCASQNMQHCSRGDTCRGGSAQPPHPAHCHTLLMQCANPVTSGTLAGGCPQTTVQYNKYAQPNGTLEQVVTQLSSAGEHRLCSTVTGFLVLDRICAGPSTVPREALWPHLILLKSAVHLMHPSEAATTMPTFRYPPAPLPALPPLRRPPRPVQLQHQPLPCRPSHAGHPGSALGWRPWRQHRFHVHAVRHRRAVWQPLPGKVPAQPTPQVGWRPAVWLPKLCRCSLACTPVQ